MINAAELPAVRARVEDAAAADSDAGNGAADGAPPPVACYPSKTLVVEKGRYVVADPAN